MRKAFVLCVILLFSFSFSAFAGRKCMKYARFANAVMEARQVGVPLSELDYELTLWASAEGINPVLQRRIRMILFDAYRVPRRISPSMQRYEVIEFENEVYTRCVFCSDF